jgi:hypothetical protein
MKPMEEWGFVLKDEPASVKPPMRTKLRISLLEKESKS